VQALGWMILFNKLELIEIKMKTLALLFFTTFTLTGLAQNFKPTDMLPGNTPEVQAYIEELGLARINEYRIQAGVQPLIFDTILKPAADHHIKYMRLAQKMTHYETEDLPDFEEIHFVTERYWNLIDTDSITEMTELLLNNVMIYNEPGWTFSRYAEFITTNGFKKSDAHWKELMNPKWNLIYLYYDLNYKTTRSICTVILGKPS
jgi:uncharacterized protein YkwD